MAAQAGKGLLIKAGDGASPETFATVAGIRSARVAFNAETVDITNQGSAGLWRELLASAGVRSATVSGDGVFLDSASEDTVRGYFFAHSVDNYQVVIPNFGTVEGPFYITSLEYAGEYNGEATYSLTFESAGEITWTAL